MFACFNPLSCRHTFFFTVHVTLCVFLFSGCSSEDSNRASVSGTVSFNGEPLSDGSIVFIPHGGNGGPSAGGTIRNGKYSIANKKGPVVGMNRVEISSVRETGRMVTVGSGPGATEMAERVQFVPTRYNEDSQLIEELKPGRNEIDFALTDSAE